MTAKIYYRDFWGKHKLQDLSKSVVTAFNDSDPNTTIVHPQQSVGSPFVITEHSKDYFHWPDLLDLFQQDFSGVQTKRDNFLVDIDIKQLQKRIHEFFDATNTDIDLQEIYPDALKDLNKRSASKARKFFIARGISPENFLEYQYKPFDNRVLYWEGDHGYIGTPSQSFVNSVRSIKDNWYLEFRKKDNKLNFSRFLVTQKLADNMGSGFSNYLPLKTIDENGSTQSNVNRKLFVHSGTLTDEQLFQYIVAVLHSSNYCSANKSVLTTSTPRIPNDLDFNLMSELSDYGKDICCYYSHQTKHKNIVNLMRLIAIPNTAGVTDFSVHDDWGRKSRGAVFPGKGLKPTTTCDINVIDPMTGGPLSVSTCSLAINEKLKLENVPVEVLEFEISGYKVIKKWLSYRSKKVIGRDLIIDEISELKEICVRLYLIIQTIKNIDTKLKLP